MMLRRLKGEERVCEGKRAKIGGSFSENERFEGRDAFNRAEPQS